MMPVTRSADRGFWLACAAGALLVLVGCSLATIEIGQGALIGADETQRSFDYDRTIQLATYVRPGSLLFLLGAIALATVSFAAMRRGSRPLFVLVAAAISIAFLVETIRIGDELRWSESGVYSCDEGSLERCAPFIAPAVRDLQAEILRCPEARESGFELLAREGYRARGKLGWSLVLWATFALALVTAFRAFMLVLRPLWAGVAVAVCGLAVLAYLLLNALSNLE